ncbi:hypothetical protein KJA15_01120 [Patescibacteria group bacterium]|nr:hypothetical protein [Patescibacteria group bacterium]
MIETIFWIILIVVVIGLIWYFLRQKGAPAPTEEPEEKPEVPSSEIPLEVPPSATPPEIPPSETPPEVPPSETPTI